MLASAYVCDNGPSPPQGTIPYIHSLALQEFMREEAVEVWKEFGALPDRCHY